jgi:hypothetical protein
MSQCTGIEVVVVGVGVLLECIAEIGAEVQRQKQMQDAEGTTHEVDYVVRDGEAEVGVQVDRKTEKVRLIPRDCEAGKGKALAGRIAQRYAYSKALGELKRKGYTVSKEEKQADGTIRVVMQRWR